MDPALQELHVLVAKDAMGRSLVPEIGHLLLEKAALAGMALDGEYVGVVLRGLVRWLQLGAVPVGPVGRSPDWDGVNPNQVAMSHFFASVRLVSMVRGVPYSFTRDVFIRG